MAVNQAPSEDSLDSDSMSLQNRNNIPKDLDIITEEDSKCYETYAGALSPRN